MLNMTVGEFIRCEREKLGMTRNALAEAIKYSARTICDIENGSKKLSNRVIPRLAIEFGCSVGDIERLDGVARAYNEAPRVQTAGAKATDFKRIKTLCGECSMWVAGRREIGECRTGTCKKTGAQTTRCDWCTVYE